MVAQKKGRGAKAQAAKPKPAASVEEQVPETEVDQANAEAAADNGEADQSGAGEENAGGQEGGEGEQSQETAADEAKPEEKKEEKVESGKLLVENLPSSYLFDYQVKLKELFSKHGEVTLVKRGPIIVTELTTTPTLSAIVEFKNKESLDKALSEEGTVLDGNAISVAVESRAETAVLVGVPYEASTEYVRTLFSQCGEVAHIHEFSKTKYKILRVTFHAKEAVEKALKLDRELRINGFLVTVGKYRDEEEQKAHAAIVNKNKRQHSQQQQQQQNRSNTNPPANNSPNANRANFRGRGGAFNARGNFRDTYHDSEWSSVLDMYPSTSIQQMYPTPIQQMYPSIQQIGARGRGAFGGRGGTFPRGGFAPVNSYMPPQPYMGRPGGFMNDGQRPNKRLRQM